MTSFADEYERFKTETYLELRGQVERGERPNLRAAWDIVCPDPDRWLLSSSAVAKRLGVTSQQVIRLAISGELETFARLEGGNSARIFTEAAVRRLISDRARNPRCKRIPA